LKAYFVIRQRLRRIARQKRFPRRSHGFCPAQKSAAERPILAHRVVRKARLHYFIHCIASPEKELIDMGRRGLRTSFEMAYLSASITWL
jgi:hypothetical protein